MGSFKHLICYLLFDSVSDFEIIVGLIFFFFFFLLKVREKKREREQNRK